MKLIRHTANNERRQLSAEIAVSSGEEKNSVLSLPRPERYHLWSMRSFFSPSNIADRTDSRRHVQWRTTARQRKKEKTTEKRDDDGDGRRERRGKRRPAVKSTAKLIANASDRTPLAVFPLHENFLSIFAKMWLDRMRIEQFFFLWNFWNHSQHLVRFHSLNVTIW